ncbi:hypothetical protein AK812_SmicGene27324 [Symbiodinium microadriaticum]|uniref:Uncharacterized protein n=1 Tax=Symbiodinium microadriaticum TaxID=2951 RepID=A0A1Q9D7C4_SYMMI|nr:hypothetical protein AK812_SmicGene27324 [Symbiodinium microadriaticum]
MGTCSSAATYSRSASGTALDTLQIAWQGSFLASSVSSNSLGDLQRTVTFAMLLEQGVVIQYNQSMGDVIFVSHQWTSYTHPDPHFHQLWAQLWAFGEEVLQQALTNLLQLIRREDPVKRAGHGGCCPAEKKKPDDNTPVHPQFMNFVPVGSRQRLTAEAYNVTGVVTWLYFCPVRFLRMPAAGGDAITGCHAMHQYGVAPKAASETGQTVLAPVMEHAENGKMLSKHSWTDADLRQVMNLPGRKLAKAQEEVFRKKVPVERRSMVQRKLDSLLRRKDIHGYRLLLNMQHVHLQMRIGECRKCSPSPSSDKEAEKLVASFLEALWRFDIRLFLQRNLCAILQQGANVNERMKSKDDGAERASVSRRAGNELVPSLRLHLAAQFGNNEALQLLIQAPVDFLDFRPLVDFLDFRPLWISWISGVWEKAELNSQDQLGMSPLHRATLGDNAVGVQLLLQAGSDPACREKIAKFTAIGPAAAWGSLRGIHAIMEHSPLQEFRWHVAVLGEGSSVGTTAVVPATAPTAIKAPARPPAPVMITGERQGLDLICHLPLALLKVKLEDGWE